MQLEAHAPSVPPSETIPPPGLTEDSTLIPLTALTALDDAIENLGVPVPCRSYDPEVFFAESCGRCRVRQVPLPHLPADGGLPHAAPGAA